MPAIITNKFRLNNAEQFSESFSEAANNKYYLGIGRPQPYGTLTRPDGRTDFEKYLRPSTLFNATKFTEYHSEKLTPTSRYVRENISNSQIGFYD